MAARIELVLTESDVSIVNNTSKVTAKLYYYGNGVSYSGYQKTWKITIDGTTYSGTNTFTTSTSAQLLGTVSKTVTHNDNGAKTVSVSASFATGVSIGTLTTSKSLTLTTIPRVSDIEVDKTSLFAGEDIIATATPKSSSFTDVITLSMGSHTATLTSGEAYTIPLNWLDAVPNAMKGTASVTVKTYNGSTLIGSKTVNVTVKVPASVVPSVDSIEITEGVSSVETNFGVFVKNLSQLLVEITASGIYGSTISSVKTTVDGITYAGAQFTSNVIRTAGSLTVTVNVTDSRGQTATGTTTVTIEDYEKPYVNIEVQQSGTTATLTITGKVYAIDATGTAKNTKSLLLQYKKVTDTGYTEEALTVESWDFEITKNITIDESVTYEFIATVSDKINSTSAVTQTGIVVISRRAGGTGVTFGGEAEQDGFVCKWPAQFDSGLTAGAGLDMTAEEIAEINTSIGTTGNRLANFLKSMAYKLGLIADYVVEQGTSGIWTYKKWASGEAELRATFVTTTAYAITTAYGNVYRYNEPFTIAFSGVPFSFVDYDTDSEIFVTIKGDGMDFSGSARLSSGNALTFFWMNPTSYTAMAGSKIQIIIKGRWK